ncbi:saccharopine dehydrogenase C-terminal domain-containing protein [candidate division CSSED10-310 bacterium]|uniref:Saccharopine dehydrogenase C-terminal domain-containing protein n=1 Tax=candidate division CSSED10-310 bacterium TaxID=2855610 RepID=A0ABV6Z158_UNCC1
MKKILVLGAGLVAKPLVQYLLDQSDIQVMVASRTVSKAEKLVGDHPRGFTRSLDVSDESTLNQLIASHDLTISLLPWTHHMIVAKMCLENTKHLVTTSYVKEEMNNLDQPTRERGLLFLNEIGLDPGIDHMSAMKIIHHVRDNGGKITSFRSYCGGLPALEANNNPFGYKFSWSPKGVILAATNPAQYMVDSKTVSVLSQELFDDYHFIDIPGLGTYEAYPNRDSLPYIDLYGFKSIETMYRGTLRNIGHCETWRNLVALGLLDNENSLNLADKTTVQFFNEFILKAEQHDVYKTLVSKLDLKKASVLLRKLQWLGLLDNEALNITTGTAVDVLTDLMTRRLEYAAGERDLVILHHDFLAEYPTKKEKITSTLIDNGIPHGDTAMSRTVGLPAAIAAALIVRNEIKLTGVRIPVDGEVYNPVMKELVALGVDFNEVYQTV